MDLVRLRRELTKKLAAHNNACQRVKDEATELENVQTRIQKISEAQEHLQHLAQSIQQEAHKQIGEIVTKCLGTVFDGMYELKIDFVRLRGKTEAVLVYMKEGREVNPLLTSGGVLDVSALALRIANLVLSDPASRMLLVLDEPFTGVSATNLPKLCAVIEALSRELGIQFLICTHVEALKIGTVIQLG